MWELSATFYSQSSELVSNTDVYHQVQTCGTLWSSEVMSASSLTVTMAVCLKLT